MLEIITGRREQYAALRSADLPNSVPLALNFNVHTSDPNPAPVPRTYAMSAGATVTRPADLEDAAFYTVTQLAQLIRTRQVTSLELTEMYLARLKRYDETLLCVAAYTEDLAIAQASAPMPRSPAVSIVVPCMASPGAPRTCSPRAAFQPSGALRPTATSRSTSTPLSCSAWKQPAPCSSPS